MRGIHLVTNGKTTEAELIQLSNFHYYFDYIHLREKTKTAAEMVEMISIVEKNGIPLSKIVINDRVDLAILKGCKGVQLAYHSLPVKLVKEQFPHLKTGKSVHSTVEARKAEADGADFVLYGHIFSSKSKQGVSPQGIESLKTVANATSIPVIAIGGIQPDQVTKVLNAGARGIAMISSIWEAHNPPRVAKAYYDMFNQWKEMQHETL